MTQNDQTRTRTIDVAALARVEGEGAMHVKVKDGNIEDLRFEIFEPNSGVSERAIANIQIVSAFMGGLLLLGEATAPDRRSPY